MASTRTVAGPTAGAASSSKVRFRSPGPLRSTCLRAAPVTASGPSTWMETSKAPRLSAMANRETGTSTRSPGPMTRGRVESTISSLFTSTVFSARPKRRPRAPTAMARTAPT